MSPDARIAELNLELPPPPEPKGVYRPLVVDGNKCCVSGHGPVQSDGTLMSGCVGKDISRQEGYDAARQVGLTMLATLRKQFGSLDKVVRVIKVLGMVNCTRKFENHPAVINGFSELMAQVFGEENGIGARSAVGMGSLPDNIPVEVEAIFEIVPAST